MVEYQKVGASFILADFLLNLNKKNSKPRQKKNMGSIFVIQM